MKIKEIERFDPEQELFERLQSDHLIISLHIAVMLQCVA